MAGEQVNTAQTQQPAPTTQTQPAQTQQPAPTTQTQPAQTQQPAPTTQTQPAQTQQPAPTTQTQPAGTQPPAEVAPPANAGEGIVNLLADEPQPPATQPQQAPAASPEAAAKLAEVFGKLPDIDVGKTFDGIERKFTGAEMAALVPELARAGVPASGAEAVVRAYAALDKARLDAENAAAARAINARAEECRKAFGNDLGRVTGFARKALAMMDPSLAAELKATPVLVNDRRFLKFLADVGERFDTDDGTGARNAAPSETHGFDVGRLLPR